MKDVKESIYEVKEYFLKSPLRDKLAKGEGIPFKNLVINDLHDNMTNIEILDKSESKPLKVVVVGEVKSGKSTLVNALLKKDISEIDVLEATSSIIEISYGDEYESKIVDGAINISLNLEILKRINIVDTPGLRSMTTKNENKTLNYIQNADFIIFVIDATHIGQEDIIDVLELIESFKKPIIGVINKCDLLDSDKMELMDYIQEEYGIYIDKFFLISSYLEYEEKLNSNKVEENENKIINNYEELKEDFSNFIKYIEDLYRDSQEVKYESINYSLQGIIQKEVLCNYDYFKSILMIEEETNKYEKILRNKLDYISSKMNYEIDDWIDRVFLCNQLGKIKENLDSASDYINENYINQYINEKKDELDKLFFEEWEECLNEVEYEINTNINKNVERVYYKNEFLNSTHYKVDKEDMNINEVLATVGTGALLGVTSGGIASVYAAAVGSSAASMTIGTALMVYCPPLLVAGTISGAVGKLIYEKVKINNRSKNILNDIEQFIGELKESVKSELKSNYYKCSEEIVTTASEIFKKEKGITMSKYGLEEFIKEIETYIKELKQYIKE